MTKRGVANKSKKTVVVSEVIQDNRKYIKKIIIKKLAVWKKVLLVVNIILLFCTCNKTVY